MTNSTLIDTRKLVMKGLVGFFCWGATFAQASVTTAKTTVGYFGQVPAAEFESKIKPVFEANSRRCKNCELVNLTPYSPTGEIDLKALSEKIETVPTEVSFVFFDFNTRATEQNKKWVEALNKKSAEGLLVVGTAGAPIAPESSGPLSRTVLGQVHGSFIVGELTDRDRLTPSGFYGPEMLTALRGPKDLLGQGYVPLIFAANLAENWHKRSSQEWSEHFKTKKIKTRKIWLSLNDLF